MNEVLPNIRTVLHLPARPVVSTGDSHPRRSIGVMPDSLLFRPFITDVVRYGLSADRRQPKRRGLTAYTSAMQDRSDDRQRLGGYGAIWMIFGLGIKTDVASQKLAACPHPQNPVSRTNAASHLKGCNGPFSFGLTDPTAIDELTASASLQQKLDKSTHEHRPPRQLVVVIFRYWPFCSILAPPCITSRMLLRALKVPLTRACLRSALLVPLGVRGTREIS